MHKQKNNKLEQSSNSTFERGVDADGFPPILHRKFSILYKFSS